MAEPQDGRYLFAVTRGLEPHALDGVPGLGGSSLELVEHDGLQAVVCSVDLAEFGESALREHLEDLAWVEEVARGHHDVVSATAAAGTVAPMRLVTICHDDDSVRARLADAHDDLVAALDRVEGRMEWSVKAYAVPGDPPASPPPARGEESGAAYLRRKRDEAQRRRGSADRATADAELVHGALVDFVVASRLLGPQDPQLSGRRNPMVLNAAYLVDQAAGEQFRELVQRVAKTTPGLDVSVEGPWPPYSFAALS